MKLCGECGTTVGYPEDGPHICGYDGDEGVPIEICRYDQRPLLTVQERDWRMCKGCYERAVLEVVGRQLAANTAPPLIGDNEETK